MLCGINLDSCLQDQYTFSRSFLDRSRWKPLVVRNVDHEKTVQVAPFTCRWEAEGSIRAMPVPGGVVYLSWSSLNWTVTVKETLSCCTSLLPDFTEIAEFPLSLWRTKENKDIPNSLKKFVTACTCWNFSLQLAGTSGLSFTVFDA